MRFAWVVCCSLHRAHLSAFKLQTPRQVGPVPEGPPLQTLPAPPCALPAFVYYFALRSMLCSLPACLPPGYGSFCVSVGVLRHAKVSRGRCSARS